MGPKTFQKIVDNIYPIRSYYSKGGIVWDYPTYPGLPRRVSMKLSPEAVDAMQYILYVYEFHRKRDFARAYKKRLGELGEHGWWKIKIK